MAKIELSGLSEEELRELNRAVIDRLRFLSYQRNQKTMRAFALGDTVSFETDSATITGTIIRMNQKTVTLVTRAGQQWRVSPACLRLVGVAPEKPQLKLMNNHI